MVRCKLRWLLLHGKPSSGVLQRYEAPVAFSVASLSDDDLKLSYIEGELTIGKLRVGSVVIVRTINLNCLWLLYAEKYEYRQALKSVT